MGAHFELTKGNPEAMHPMSTCILRFDNDIGSQLHEVLERKCHLRAKALGGAIQVTWKYFL